MINQTNKTQQNTTKHNKTQQNTQTTQQNTTKQQNTQTTQHTHTHIHTHTQTTQQNKTQHTTQHKANRTSQITLAIKSKSQPNQINSNRPSYNRVKSYLLGFATKWSFFFFHRNFSSSPHLLPNQPPSVASIVNMNNDHPHSDADDEDDSDFRQLCILICPGCGFLEYPGCNRHHCLLSVRKGNGHMVCHGCRQDAEESGKSRVIDDEAATDTSLPWCELCRECEMVRANVNVSGDMMLIIMNLCSGCIHLTPSLLNNHTELQVLDSHYRANESLCCSHGKTKRYVYSNLCLALHRMPGE